MTQQKEALFTVIVMFFNVEVYDPLLTISPGSSFFLPESFHP